MTRGSAIRRLRQFARRHGGDSVFALLFITALAFGGVSALSGLGRFAEAMTPDMAAVAAAPPLASDHARLALSGVTPSSRYAPQILFPVQSHDFPDWLLAHMRQRAAPAARPVIAICIDDLGEDVAGTARAMALPRQVALSFLPYAQATPALAQDAARKGHEILAHVPMEAVGRASSGRMTLKAGAPDIAGGLAWNLARVPGLVGINNHEGSKFTADAAALAPVAEALAARRLFFFDSRTTAQSRVVEVSHMFGVASAARDIFLDDTASAAAIAEQLKALEARAKANGVAIAIGHPHDLTLTLLKAWLAEDHGVTLVTLSEAMRLKTRRLAMAAR